MQKNTNHFLSTTDLAARLRVSTRTLRRLVIEGAVPAAARVAGMPVYDEAQVSRALGLRDEALEHSLLTLDELRSVRPELQPVPANMIAESDGVIAVRVGRQWRFLLEQSTRTRRCTA